MTQNWTPNVVVKAFRSVCAMLDTAIYTLLGFMYEIFFNVASADILSNETILAFYKRVQLIIGVYMVFNLAIIIMKGIVSPDTVTDNKSGVGGFIKRIILALVMLTVLTPISIPSAANEYEKQLNNNGLLFGTLYSLQYRILNNNTLGRLILGTNDTGTTSSSSNASGISGATTQAETLKKSANTFTSTILKGFVRINLREETDDDPYDDPGDGKSYETLNSNRMCQDIDDDTLEVYTATDASPGDILSLVNATCVPDSNILTGAINKALSFFNLSGNTKFAFSYMLIVSGIVGAVFIFLFISFTVDIAVRAIKLAVLRLLAPIPVIQYMDPSGKGDNAFNSWVKTVSQTYLDLFIRLASVYFVIFIIQDICTNGIAMNITANAVGAISFIFICIGLFAFAKQAPKFIQDLLGLKNPPGSLFGGFGQAATAFGAAAGVVGSVGSFRAGMKASRLADETRQAFGENVDPNSFLNRGKHLLAGFAGGIGGARAGVGAAMSAKDHGFRSSIEAMSKYNSGNVNRGNSGSTLFGRVGSLGSNIFTGEGASAEGERTMSSLKSKKSALDAVKSRVSSEMVKKNWTSGDFGANFVDRNGNQTMTSAQAKAAGVRFNYKDVMARYSQAQSLHQERFEVKDTAGNSHYISLAEAERQKGFLLKNNEDDYLQRAQDIEETVVNGQTVRKIRGTSDDEDKVLSSALEDAWDRGAFTDIDNNPTATMGHVTRASVTSNGIDRIGNEMRQVERDNIIHKANDQFAGKK